MIVRFEHQGIRDFGGYSKHDDRWPKCSSMLVRLAHNFRTLRGTSPLSCRMRCNAAARSKGSGESDTL